MSGFSPAWLTLREPADQAARNRDVLAACARYFDRRPSVKICDIGAGTGASLRAFAHLLPAQQSWTLIDHDAGNLAAAMEALAAWADHVVRTGAQITLQKDGNKIDVTTRVQDLAENVSLPAGADLVTASALFDLVSTPWIDRFIAALTAARCPLLATLTANEHIEAAPPHPLDEKIVASFHRHQTRDKGFGPSAGAAAAGDLEQALARAGYLLTAGDSPWVLEPSPMLEATVAGIAGAVAEIGDVD